MNILKKALQVLALYLALTIPANAADGIYLAQVERLQASQKKNHYIKEAAKGNPSALYKVGMMYYTGEGNFSRNYVEAYAYIKVSGIYGYYGYQAMLKTLTERMSPAEIQRANSKAEKMQENLNKKARTREYREETEQRSRSNRPGKRTYKATRARKNIP